MLKDITLGQYYPTGSVIHKLDPRTKLAATILYLVSVFLFRGLAGLCLAAVIPFVCAGVAGIPLRLMLRGIRGIIVIVILTAFFNLFFTDGLILWHFGVMRITDQGIHNAVFYTLRLILLVTGASILTLTTPPNRLADGMETSCRFLEKLKVPVHEIAMMMSIALRFVPILGEEAETIKQAQLARCADFDSGGLLKRVKGRIPVIIPLFVSAFQKAQDLSLAMDARCYGAASVRTRLHPLRYSRRDAVAYILAAAVFVLFIWLRFHDLALPF